MPKKRTAKIEQIKETLKQRTRSGYYYPGDRFFSNRAISERYGISYQTAHRLMKELEVEGFINRRPQSGTYLSGTKQTLDGVCICFAPRAGERESFGGRLLSGLTEALTDEGILWKKVETDCRRLPPHLYPVIWEKEETKEQALRENRFSLVLNERSRPGLAAALTDSITMDNFSGGAAAGELILNFFPGRKTAVFTGPSSDNRNLNRRDGFLSIFPNAEVLSAESWYYADALKVVPALLKKKPEAVFCCNDRLASALINSCAADNLKLPVVIGFDNAPISEKMNFSTIAIPWDEMIKLAVKIIKMRIEGNTETTMHYELNPRPVLRGTFLSDS